MCKVLNARKVGKRSGLSSSLIAEAVKASAVAVLGRRSSVFDLDGRTYALEHTVVEVFDGQIRKENA
jgi:hypothetical protein